MKTQRLAWLSVTLLLAACGGGGDGGSSDSSTSNPATNASNPATTASITYKSYDINNALVSTDTITEGNTATEVELTPGSRIVLGLNGGSVSTSTKITGTSTTATTSLQVNSITSTNYDVVIKNASNTTLSVSNIRGNATTVVNIPIVSLYAGNYTGTMSGNFSAQCSNIVVTKRGTVSGSCTSASQGNFTLSGNVSDAGQVDLSAEISSTGTTTTFTGTMSNAKTGAGTWKDVSLSLTGNWSISRP